MKRGMIRSWFFNINANTRGRLKIAMQNSILPGEETVLASSQLDTLRSLQAKQIPMDHGFSKHKTNSPNINRGGVLSRAKQDFWSHMEQVSHLNIREIKLKNKGRTKVGKGRVRGVPDIQSVCL